MGQQSLKSSDALLLVDVQVDFCPGGALPVPHGDEVVAPLNDWISAATRAGVPVIASRDWHPRHHPSFEPEGGDWPPHCIQDTSGADFHPGLKLPEEVIVVSKGVRFDKDQYSAFDDTGLGEFLRERGVERIWLGGLALDVCVRATVLEARREGFEVHLLTDASRAIDAEEGARSIDEMRDLGAVIDPAT